MVHLGVERIIQSLNRSRFRSFQSLSSPPYNLPRGNAIQKVPLMDWISSNLEPAAKASFLLSTSCNSDQPGVPVGDCRWSLTCQVTMPNGNASSSRVGLIVGGPQAYQWDKYLFVLYVRSYVKFFSFMSTHVLWDLFIIYLSGRWVVWGSQH